MCRLLSALEVRIIPTRMGTRTVRPTPSSVGRDHPHAYGDKLCFKKSVVFHVGSSPRVWGQGQIKLYYTTYSRIIPTRMGTRSIVERRQWTKKDHPHAYGDKDFKPCVRSVPIGSSPRVWGQATPFRQS